MPNVRALTKKHDLKALVPANDPEAVHQKPDAEALVRANNPKAFIHATTNATPNIINALVQANLGDADNSTPDAMPNAAPDHLPADRAADLAPHLDVQRMSIGRRLELHLLPMHQSKWHHV
jgi:hypothetical protein